MKNKRMRWGILALVAFIALFLAAYILPALPKPKARASRISAVNHLANLSVIIPGTNALASGEAPSVPPPPAEFRTFSDGGTTWRVGAVTVKGTNVPLTNVSIRATTNKAPR